MEGTVHLFFAHQVASEAIKNADNRCIGDAASDRIVLGISGLEIIDVTVWENAIQFSRLSTFLG